jgi:fructose-1,6-bisphosphatase/inositol monophosphatase family enzyme
MLVATGQAAATLYASSYAHDVVAAGLIVSEAGGRITDVFGEPQRYDRGVRGSIISNGAVHGELVTIAKRHQVLPA